MINTALNIAKKIAPSAMSALAGTATAQLVKRAAKDHPMVGKVAAGLGAFAGLVGAGVAATPPMNVVTLGLGVGAAIASTVLGFTESNEEKDAKEIEEQTNKAQTAEAGKTQAEGKLKAKDSEINTLKASLAEAQEAFKALEKQHSINPQAETINSDSAATVAAAIAARAKPLTEAPNNAINAALSDDNDDLTPPPAGGAGATNGADNPADGAGAAAGGNDAGNSAGNPAGGAGNPAGGNDAGNGAGNPAGGAGNPADGAGATNGADNPADGAGNPAGGAGAAAATFRRRTSSRSGSFQPAPAQFNFSGDPAAGSPPTRPTGDPAGDLLIFPPSSPSIASDQGSGLAETVDAAASGQAGGTPPVSPAAARQAAARRAAAEAAKAAVEGGNG